MVSTIDGYPSNKISVAPDHGSNNNDCAVTADSVADNPPFDDDETFSNLFAMPHLPDSASFSSPSSDDENID